MPDEPKKDKLNPKVKTHSTVKYKFDDDDISEYIADEAELIYGDLQPKVPIPVEYILSSYPEHMKTITYDHTNPGPYKEVAKAVVIFLDNDDNPTQMWKGNVTEVTANGGHYIAPTISVRLVNPVHTMIDSESPSDEETAPGSSAKPSD